ncbi:pentatricopeptide repeat-containing protein At1g15480, mitochondrial-like [Benincasa hispida]|uniref:pentatricopeptide repeat-containing protein At1g15480, mitochondrial-like n=1 Tax=Benincasa hispida TaxID=102211 RepID=UPI001901EFA1|nr:pentatricopeptide repeat-containing protein At1g15480, mitochondrial-like [Benincasa hispida]XP_038906203.1 pentatricopeptide repeat-containing protein At1g15480, mitochondrial-like [Benincasa hispida]
MWALRRASISLRNQGYRERTSYFFGKLEVPYSWEGNVAGFRTTAALSDRCISFERNNLATWPTSGIYISSRGLSSQAGAENSGEEDNVEDGFSELDETLPSTSPLEDSKAANDNEEELTSGSEIDDGTRNELDLPEVETELAEKISKKGAPSALFEAIWSASGLSVPSVLDKWVSEGKEISRADISLAMLNLRRRRMFGKALQFSEWLESSGQLDFIERDYASRLHLIAKVQGLHKAESYIANIPKSFQGEVVYRTLMANYVVARNVKKVEEVFNKMKELGFRITTFACNRLLLLYKRVDKRKIADVLLLMEKENVKPSLLSYKILIDAKGESKDMIGMEQVVDTMKAEGIELDVSALSILVKHYASGGLKDKAKAILKEMEDVNIKGSKWACRILLPLYGELQMEDEVRRLWKICESNPRIEECLAAIVAWGKLKNIPEAEKIFDRVVKTWKKLSAKQYSTMLKVYADNKMLVKGKELVKQMADSGCRIGPFTWDAIVKLYVEAGEVEKADSFLVKAVQKNQMKPLFTSYMIIMDQYARRGDVHNAEKILYKMRLSGYVARFNDFQTLIQAYINAKAPAYGMKERMKADNVFPNRDLARKLAQVDAFRNTAVSDLLD